MSVVGGDSGLIKVGLFLRGKNKVFVNERESPIGDLECKGFGVTGSSHLESTDVKQIVTWSATLELSMVISRGRGKGIFINGRVLIPTDE